MENINEEKRRKFMEYAGKRVNNVLHDIQILEPMARSNAYDFTKQDVEEMFIAMQETLNEAKTEFDKKFEEKARATKKVFSFGATPTAIDNKEIENTFGTIEESQIENIESIESVEEDIEETIGETLDTTATTLI